MADVWSQQEFAGADVPDKRQVRVLSALAVSLCEHPEVAFSVAVGHGGRQAARRLTRNQQTTPDGILLGHYQQTAARCARHELVLAIQDTTVLDYSTHHATSGLGPVGNSPHARGLLSHSVLALSPQGQPLGLLGLQVWARDPQDAGSRHKKRLRTHSQKESRKWLNGLRAVQEHLPASQSVLLVQDREADVFAFLAAPRRERTHLLVRACQPRFVELEGVGSDAPVCGNLMSLVSEAKEVGVMQVRVPAQPGRAEREAHLILRATSLRVHPPKNGQRDASFRPLQITVIEARETPSADIKVPIHWVLLTTMPVSTTKDCIQMVHYYSLRWMIERLHYVLKSGCRVERLQIDDAGPLINAVSIYYVVAWRLLSLTHLARTEPDRPPDEVLQSDEIQVLSAHAQRPIDTVRAAVHAIAVLGGHVLYRNAPPPGPKTIWTGLRRLQAMVLGWHLARPPANALPNQD